MAGPSALDGHRAAIDGVLVGLRVLVCRPISHSGEEITAGFGNFLYPDLGRAFSRSPACQGRSVDSRWEVIRWDGCLWRCPARSARLITCAAPSALLMTAARSLTCCCWPP